MTFGERIRNLRLAKQPTLRHLAAKVGVGFTYLSKIENRKLEDGHAPSEKLIHKLAEALDADEEELLLLAEKVPTDIKRRLIERADAFRTLAGLSDAELNEVMREMTTRFGPRKND